MRNYSCPEEAQSAYEAERAWEDEQVHLASESAAAAAEAEALNEMPGEFETIDGKWWLFENGKPIRPLTDDETRKVIWGGLAHE